MYALFLYHKNTQSALLFPQQPAWRICAYLLDTSGGTTLLRQVLLVIGFACAQALATFALVKEPLANAAIYLPTNLISLTASIAAFLFLALASRHGFTFAKHPSASVFGCALVCLCAALSLSPTLAFAYESVGYIMHGCGFSLLFAMWGEACLRLPDANSRTCCACSLGLAAAIHLVISALDCPIAGCSIVIAFVSTITFIAYNSKAELVNAEEDGSAPSQSGPVTAILSRELTFTIAVFCVAQALIRSYLEASNHLYDQVLFRCICIAVMAALAIYSALHKGSRSFDPLNPFVLLLALSVLCMPVFVGNHPNLAFALVRLASTLFIYVAFTIALVNYRAQCHASPLFILSSLWFVFQLSTLCGKLLGTFLRYQAANGLISTFAVALLIVYTLLVAMLFLHAQMRLRPHADDASKSTSVDSPDVIVANRTFSDIAKTHGLTPRETEVFSMLARGRSLPFIESELVISHSTAKTHARRIYSKLGVSNKQELLDLVEGQQDLQKP